MMTRRKARENAFIAVFEAGFSSNDIQEILSLTQEVPEYEEYRLDEFAISLINNYYNNAEEFNEIIQSKLKNWSQARISRVASAVLRLSVAEMLFSIEKDMDSVIINEAV